MHEWLGRAAALPPYWRRPQLEGPRPLSGGVRPAAPGSHSEGRGRDVGSLDVRHDLRPGTMGWSCAERFRRTNVAPCCARWYDAGARSSTILELHHVAAIVLPPLWCPSSGIGPLLCVLWPPAARPPRFRAPTVGPASTASSDPAYRALAARSRSLRALVDRAPWPPPAPGDRTRSRVLHLVSPTACRPTSGAVHSTCSRTIVDHAPTADTSGDSVTAFPCSYRQRRHPLGACH